MSRERRFGARLPSLGSRGQGWVAGQFALAVPVVAAGLAGPRWSRELRAARGSVGIALLISGAVLASAGARALGRSLTPFPMPREGGSLSERSVYRLVRHPIYGGVIVGSAGWSVLTRPWALVPSAVLAGFLDLKARREEAWLVERHPGYASYRERVRHRFVPFLA